MVTRISSRSAVENISSIITADRLHTLSSLDKLLPFHLNTSSLGTQNKPCRHHTTISSREPRTTIKTKKIGITATTKLNCIINNAISRLWTNKCIITQSRKPPNRSRTIYLLIIITLTTNIGPKQKYRIGIGIAILSIHVR